MFQLIRLTLALFVICAVAIFAAHLVGRTQPSPLAALFTNPDGSPCERPCLFGIRPGMPMGEAVILLKKHTLISNIEDMGKGGFEVSLFGDRAFIIIGRGIESSATVGNIGIMAVEYHNHMPFDEKFPFSSVGSVVVSVGQPAYLVSEDFDYFWLGLDSDFIVQVLSEDNMSTPAINSKVIGLILHEPYSEEFKLLSGRWCGFTTRKCQKPDQYEH